MSYNRGFADINIREQSEMTELGVLAKCAAVSRDAARSRFEERCPIRTEYQRDRDRIIHCNAFRRLKSKTQVFLAPVGDHYRTRLTHTLEVSQIARTVARALRLNEDLTEAIALAHDLGHTPFGHSGEAAINALAAVGFKHYIQSVRVVEYIERDGAGLNLTLDVKNGIATHSGKTALPRTLEGQVVRLCDKIAYINHDIEDAVRAGVLSDFDLPADCIHILGASKSARITTMVKSIIANGIAENFVLSNSVLSDGDVSGLTGSSGISGKRAVISMDENVKAAHDKLRAFLFERVYENPTAKGEENKAKGVIEALFEYFLRHPDKLPADYLRIAETRGNERAVIDYISGCTDHYALDMYSRLFVPKVWMV